MMEEDVRELVTSYIRAVGEGRLEALPALLDPDATFTVGDNTLRGAPAFVGAFEAMLPILVRNDIRKIFVDGSEACVIYDFVTDTPAGALLSMEYITTVNGRIVSSLLVFERLHLSEEVVAEITRRTTI